MMSDFGVWRSVRPAAFLPRHEACALYALCAPDAPPPAAGRPACARWVHPCRVSSLDGVRCQSASAMTSPGDRVVGARSEGRPEPGETDGRERWGHAPGESAVGARADGRCGAALLLRAVSGIPVGAAGCRDRGGARASFGRRGPGLVGWRGVPHGKRGRGWLPCGRRGPVRSVTLRPFRIDRVAVSNAPFAAFVDATRHVTEAERYGWSFVFAGLLSGRLSADPGLGGGPVVAAGLPRRLAAPGRPAFVDQGARRPSRGPRRLHRRVGLCAWAGLGCRPRPNGSTPRAGARNRRDSRGATS